MSDNILTILVWVIVIALFVSFMVGFLVGVKYYKDNQDGLHVQEFNIKTDFQHNGFYRCGFNESLPDCEDNCIYVVEVRDMGVGNK